MPTKRGKDTIQFGQFAQIDEETLKDILSPYDSSTAVTTKGVENKSRNKRAHDEIDMMANFWKRGDP